MSQLKCQICGHSVSSMNHKEGNAAICQVCRDSNVPILVALNRFANGEVHFSLRADGDPRSEIDTVTQVIPAELARSKVALLLDLQHRANLEHDPTSNQMVELIMDVLPTMIARALSR